MKFLEFQELFIRQWVFSLHEILLFDPTFKRQQLIKRKNNGLIRNLINGYWILEWAQKRPWIKPYIANRLAEPSYLSLEWWLEFYNLIPEASITYTSVTSKKSKEYDTSIWRFKYQSLRPNLYRWYTMFQIENYSFRLWTIEKVVLDYLYLHPELDCNDAFDEWRINTSELASQRNKDLFLDRAKEYNKSTLKRAQLLISYTLSNV